VEELSDSAENEREALKVVYFVAGFVFANILSIIGFWVVGR
jgi:heme/copper-type cytochrome/quinol oxidase subunit 4